ncbi:hypothetical protein R2281_003880 [Cronobacter dublinensis]|nr:hypothetical protein [Cronobacter dublinensis]
MSEMSKEHDGKLRELCDDLKRWQGYYDPVDDKGQHEMFVSAADAVTELLALRKERESAVPVAYMYRDRLHSDARFSLEPRFGNWSPEDIAEYEVTETKLYAAPPSQPVAVPDEDDFEKAFRSWNPDKTGPYVKHQMKFIWEACRDAMLAAPGHDYKAIVERIAEILHGKVTDLDLLTVTAQSMKDQCKALRKEREAAVPVYQERRFHVSGKKQIEYWAEINKGAYQYLPESERRIVYAAPPAQPVAVPEWTNEECFEFLSIAFRHAEIKGDFELDDLRLGVKMVNESRAAMLAAPGKN